MKKQSLMTTIDDNALRNVSGGAQPAGIATAVNQLKTDAQAGNVGAIKTDAAAIKTAAQAFAATKKGGGQ